MVGFVEDEEGAREVVTEEVTQGSSVGFVDEEAVGNQEAGVGGEGIGRKAALLADGLDPLFVEDLEAKAEAGGEFVLPLGEHGRGTGDEDVIGFFADEEFAGYEAGFYGFAEADIVGDE